MPKRIVAVTLDLWETLIQDDPKIGMPRSAARIRRMTDALVQAGYAVSENDLERAYESSFVEIEAIQATDIEVNIPDQLRMLLRALGITTPLNPDHWHALLDGYVLPLLDSPPRPAPNVLEALDSLRASGYPLALICNTGRSPGWVLRDLLARYNILDRLDVTLFSDEVGIRKPDAVIFRRAAEVLNVEPSRLLHVGDNPRDDIHGAKSAGFAAIWIDRPKAPRTAGELKLAESLDPLEHPDATIADLSELPNAVARVAHAS